MTSIGLLGAFLGGILTLISPCSALLLPAFFAYAFDGVGKLVTRTSLFYVGLCLTLVPLGAGLGAVGSLFDQVRPTVMLMAGIIIIIFGLMTILGKGFAFRPAQNAVGKLNGTSAISVLLLGCVYGLAGFCSGPILGSILTVAIAGGSILYGMLLMAVYSLGMVVPLFLLAILWDHYQLGQRAWLRGKPVTLGPLTTTTTSLVSGLLFILIGILFATTSGTASLGSLISTDTQFAAQVWATKVGSAAQDPLVLLSVLLVALIAGAGTLLWRHRTKPRQNTTPQGYSPPTP